MSLRRDRFGSLGGGGGGITETTIARFVASFNYELPSKNTATNFATPRISMASIVNLQIRVDNPNLMLNFSTQISPTITGTFIDLRSGQVSRGVQPFDLQMQRIGAVGNSATFSWRRLAKVGGIDGKADTQTGTLAFSIDDEPYLASLASSAINTSWSVGMTILGDPLIIYPDPVSS